MPPPEDPHKPSAHVAALRLVRRFESAMRRSDRAETVESLRELIALNAPLGGQWLQMALVAIEIGAPALARGAIDRYVESFDGEPEARFRKVAILARIGAFREALELLRELPPDVPDRFNYALSRGSAALNSGEAHEARHWLEEAARLRPQSGQAWHQLAQLVDFAREPALHMRLAAARQSMEGQPAHEGALYCYALGKAYADHGDHARAFAAFEYAAATVGALFPNDRAAERASAADAVRGYDAGRIAAVARQQSEPTGRTIFVTGLPRSGTTLVEQILTSHSAVSDGGEIDLLRLLVHELGDASFPALDRYVAKAGVPPLARYWGELIEGRFPQPGRVVDKTTTTTRMLGVAAAVLPDAPLIWLRRDPLDCAWSCFRTCFMQGIRWSNDLSDIADTFRLEDQLLQQWQGMLGDRLLVVPLEQLASTPEPWIRRIVSHCGLSEEPPVFAPHENPRAVATASAMQVRRPISRAGIGSAEPYRAFMEPFTRAYFG